MLKKIIQIWLCLMFLLNMHPGPIFSKIQKFPKIATHDKLNIQSALLKNETVTPIAINQLVDLYNNNIISDENLTQCLDHLYKQSAYKNLKGFLEFAARLMIQIQYPYVKIKAIKIVDKVAQITTETGLKFGYIYEQQKIFEFENDIEPKEYIEKQIQSIEDSAEHEIDKTFDLIKLYNSLPDKKSIASFEQRPCFKQVRDSIIEKSLLSYKADDTIREFIYKIYQEQQTGLNLEGYLNTNPAWSDYLKNKIEKIRYQNDSTFKQPSVKINFETLPEPQKDLIAYFLAQNFIHIATLSDLEEDFFTNILVDINSDETTKQKFNKFFSKAISISSLEDINKLANNIHASGKNINLIIEVLDAFILAGIFGRHVQAEPAVTTHLENVIEFLQNNFEEGTMSKKIKDLEDAVTHAKQKTINQDTPLKDFLETQANKNWLILEVMVKNIYKYLSKDELYPAVQWAAKNGHTAIVKFLAEIATKEDSLKSMLEADNFSAFRHSAANGHTAIVKFLAEIATKENSLKSMLEADNFSAFRHSAAKGHTATVKFLAKLATKENSLKSMLEANNFSAFQQAADNGHIAIVKFLAEIATKEDSLKSMLEANNFSAFRHSAAKGHTATVKFLAKLATKEDSLKSMLEANNFSAFQQAADNGHIAIVKFLAEIATKEDSLKSMLEANNFSAFQWAADNGHTAIVKFLAEIATKEDSLKSMLEANRFFAFQQAAEHGHTAIVKFLIKTAKQTKIFIQMFQSRKFYAFGFAASNGHLKIIKLLIKEARNNKILKKMLKSEHFFAFRNAALHNHIEILKILLKEAENNGILKEMLEAFHFYAFRHPANRGNTQVIKLLVKAAKQANILDQMLKSERNDEEDFDAFFSVAEKGFVEIVKTLVEAAQIAGLLQDMFQANNFAAFKNTKNLNIKIFLIEKIIQYQIFQQEEFLRQIRDPQKNKKYALIFDILQNNIETNELIVTVNKNNKNIKLIKTTADEIAKLNNVTKKKFITYVWPPEKKLKRVVKKLNPFSKKIFSRNKDNYEYETKTGKIATQIVLKKTYKTGFVVEVHFSVNQGIPQDVKFKEKTQEKTQAKSRAEIYKILEKENLDIARARRYVINQLFLIFNSVNKDIFNQAIEIWLPNTKEELLNFDLKKISPALMAA